MTNLKKGYVCGPAEQISYAYNRSQQDALRVRIYQLYFDKQLYMFRTDLLSIIRSLDTVFNPLNAELNPIYYLLALLGAHHFPHVSRIRVKSLTLRLLMSYVYGAPILDVSRAHTTTHHSR